MFLQPNHNLNVPFLVNEFVKYIYLDKGVTYLKIWFKFPP
jgi:hypothetical protein